MLNIGELILTIIDKLIIATIMLVTGYFINKNMEQFKRELTYKSKMIDIKFEKVSLSIEKIWECKNALEKMIALFAKKSALGPFEGVADLMKSDQNMKEKFDESYSTQVKAFADSASTLSYFIDSCGFWLGVEFSSKAKKISILFMDILYGMINNDIDKKSSENYKAIDGLVADYEKTATKYFEHI